MGWKKGQSGNLKGRPKKGQTITDMIKKLLEESAPQKDKRRRKISYKEAMVRVLLHKAITLEDVQAMKLILAYCDGMPLQKIEQTGNAEKKLVIIPYGHKKNGNGKRNGKKVKTIPKPFVNIDFDDNGNGSGTGE